MKFLYKISNLEFDLNYELDNEEMFIERRNQGDYGKLARWLPLSTATSFELSREDDRRVVLVQAEVPEYIDENNVHHPATHAIYRTDIHVPDDFIVDIKNVTEEYESELEDKKTKRKEELAAKVITSVITLIKGWPISDKLALLARSDIQAVMKFLEYGSLDQSKTLVESLSVDGIFTQEIKTKILSAIELRINEYNSIVW